jgi:hypothetical protein
MFPAINSRIGFADLRNIPFGSMIGPMGKCQELKFWLLIQQVLVGLI